MSKEDFSSMRAAMVASQLRTNMVSNPKIVAALGLVERDKFVPSDRAALAYVDIPIPLAGGRSLNAPLATARLIAEAGIAAGDKILLIGAATGYASALLSALGAEVVAVEEDAALLAEATANVGGDERITLVNAALTAGHAAGAPYDAVIIDGAVDQVPQVLWDQLKEGGILAAGVVEAGVTRLAVGRKAGAAGGLISFLDVETVRLPGFEKPGGFSF